MYHGYKLDFVKLCVIAFLVGNDPQTVANCAYSQAIPSAFVSEQGPPDLATTGQTGVIVGNKLDTTQRREAQLQQQ